MRKLLVLMGIVFLVGCLFVPFASAVTVTIYSDTPTGTDVYYDHLYNDHPSLTSYASGSGFSFTASSTGYLTSVSVEVIRTGDPVGNLTGYLKNCTGSISGDTAVPIDDEVLAESTNKISIMDISASAPEHITFMFNGTYQLTSGGNYSFTVEVSDIDPSSTSGHMVAFMGEVSDTSTSTLSCFHNYGWIVDHSTYSADLWVYGSDTSGSPPTPTPTSTPSSEYGDELLEDWTDIIVDWIIPLLMVLVPAFLGLKFLGQTGFVVGLNIGALLIYLTFGSDLLWVVVLLGIVDVMFIFMTRR